MPQMLSVAGQQLLMIAADRMQVQPVLHEWILGYLVRQAQREGTAGWSLSIIGSTSGNFSMRLPWR